MGKNDLLKRQQEKIDRFVDATEETITQFMADTLFCTLHDMGWGYERMKKLYDAWQAKRDAYRPCMNGKNDEADYLRFCLDRELKDLVKDDALFQPFDERYPKLKRITYGGRR